MWTVGFFYILQGILLPYVMKRVNLEPDKQVIRLFQCMTLCGVAILLFSWMALYLNEPFKTILPIAPVLFFAAWAMVFIGKTLNKIGAK